MTPLLIIGPDWISAVCQVVVAIATIASVIIAWLKYVVVAKKDGKKGHKPFFSWNNIGFFQRSSMRAVFKGAKRISQEIAEDQKPNLIMFIGRGGAIFGSLISYNLGNIPIYCVDRKYHTDEPTDKPVTTVFPIGHIPKEFLGTVLLVAGETHSGGTIRYFASLIKEMNPDAVVKTCVYFKQKSCKVKIDYWCVEKKHSILMPWQDASFIRESLINLD